MGVRNTSRQAFYSLDDLGERQRAVLKTIQKYGPMCNLDISLQMGKPINQITPRTNELVDLGVVEESHRDISPATGRRAIFWKVSQKGINLINSLFS